MSDMIQRLLFGFVLLTACLAGDALSAAAPQIVQVVADGKRLTIRGQASGEQVQLFELAPYETPAHVSERAAVADIAVNAAGEFSHTFERVSQQRDRLYSGWLVRSAAGEVSDVRYVETLHNIAQDDHPFPTAASKKGLQVQMVDDALTLGVKHAALNVDLKQLPDLSPNPSGPTFVTDGETFHFRQSYVDHLDRQIGPLSQHGVLVYLILLAYPGGDSAAEKLMLDPRFQRSGDATIGGFNTASAEGMKWYKATLEFLAARYSGKDTPHGRVVGYTIGNEVNSHSQWYNIGRIALPDFVREYLRALRIAWTAVRKTSAHARVYVSLEHHWARGHSKDEMICFGARPFLLELAKQSSASGPFDWHVNFHPYPENLFECRTWFDQAATADTQSPKVTFKNLQVLTELLASDELRYQGQSRRVILGEQGFHTADREHAERDQAAAYCYAYYRTQQLSGVDAFILHRHVDHKGEGGLKLGLWTWQAESRSQSAPGRKKQIYDVFRAADTPQWESAFAFALPVLGIQSWQELDTNPVPPGLPDENPHRRKGKAR